MDLRNIRYSSTHFFKEKRYNLAYHSLAACVDDLRRSGQLLEIEQEIDPHLELAEIHRRIYAKGGPAIFFKKVKGSSFPVLTNLYGTNARIDFLFRKTLDKVQRLVTVKADPSVALNNLLKFTSVPFTALSALPMRQRLSRTRFRKTSISALPQIVSWPEDGGAFITLPQVCTFPVGSKSLMDSNIGMYRIQISGNDYVVDEEVGMHYQIHRGIGIHHLQYLESNEPFRVSIFVGGPPSHAVSAIFPLPEGLSEMTFAGMLGDRRFRYFWQEGFLMSSDADFVITGVIDKKQKKTEGPFGDHLGYYSLEHDFPVMRVESVYYRPNAIWHATVVGRPPQEDSGFGYLIHKLVGPLLPKEFPGVRQVHAVDVAGVHPLLLAVGSERYMPFRREGPEEILVQANHILGSGQTSLAKYLFIAAAFEGEELSAYNVKDFFLYMLQRVQLNRDLHFYTKTTIDTLDYSGEGWNAGSKLVIACFGNPVRSLGTEFPNDLLLPSKCRDALVVCPGVIVISFTPFRDMLQTEEEIAVLCTMFEAHDLSAFPLVVLVDDAAFVSRHFDNFLWVTFTRSNPSHDIYGVGAYTNYKHWGCKGPMIIDSRMKPHHAPELEVDDTTRKAVDTYFASSGFLAEFG